MDLEMRKEWRRLMRAMTKNNVGQFEFNLIQTANISLSGLGMLLLFRELKKAQRTDIKLCHCNKQIRDMLQLTGMDKYFLIQARVSGDEEEA
jgi:anti-anti-sigma factor